MREKGRRQVLLAIGTSIVAAAALSSCVFLPAVAHSDNAPITAPNSEPPSSTQVEFFNDDLPSDSCLNAVRTAAREQAELYGSHPFMNDDLLELDATSADGAEEMHRLSEDFDAKWLSIVEPIYHACHSPDDFWSAVQEYPDIGGATRADALYPGLIEAWCYGRTDYPAMCTNWDTWQASP